MEQNPAIANGTPENSNSNAIVGSINGTLNGTLNGSLHGPHLQEASQQQDISTELVHGVELLPNIVLSLIEE
jgi:hypothetical protein